MNITLIGMPGSGKSFIGKKLAERLGFSFIDTDKIIEEEFNLPLQQVVERLGHGAFLDKEAQVVAESVNKKDNLVLSPGGSVIYRADAMEHLKEVSKIYYLQVSLEMLEERIATIPRGIVIEKGKTFSDLYNERTPLYEKFADYTVAGEKSPEDIIGSIVSTLDLES